MTLEQRMAIVDMKLNHLIRTLAPIPMPPEPGPGCVETTERIPIEGRPDLILTQRVAAGPDDPADRRAIEAIAARQRRLFLEMAPHLT